jgi:ABC-type Fe3+-hydroxamate transport system substrate-binding protein
MNSRNILNKVNRIMAIALSQDDYWLLFQEIAEERQSFLISDEFDADAAPDTALARLKADPLWSRLKAVQQNHVYEVPGYWIGFEPIAANAVVNDLFKYLVDTPD